MRNILPESQSPLTLVFLSFNPGRIDPNNAAWEEARKPVAAAWQTTTGERFYTVNVHYSSKRDSSSAQGDARPPVNGKSQQRMAQVNVTAVSSTLPSHPLHVLSASCRHSSPRCLN